MSPHNDAPSPVGSFHRSIDNLPVRPVDASRLRSNLNIDIYAPSQSQYSSSVSSSEGISYLSNRTTPSSRPLLPGVYVPTVCFFSQPSEDLDTTTIACHALKLARAGVTGIATQGSNGEAVHLSHAERQTVTSVTRKALSDAGFDHMPVIVGCGAQSTRETISLCQEAYDAGGDYALVLPPSYYAPLFAPNQRSVVEFFNAVADASPIPLLIYNYPGAVSGMDLSSDLIIELSEHPNIVGVKLTCGNTGKLNRIAAATRGSKFKSSSSEAPPFLVLGGSADFTLQSLIGGGHGILAGLANLAPKSCLKITELYRKGDIAGAQKLQDIVARGDWVAIQGGIVGTKAGMEGCLGYGGSARSPLPKSDAEATGVWAGKFEELMALEESL